MDTSPVHHDLEAEQAYLTAARAALGAMTVKADAALEFGERAVREENTAEARIVRTHLRDRSESLGVGDGVLCFGRIDEDPALADGDTWYVGRRHIESPTTEPLIVDWRAPVAIPFYRATSADPQALTMRRRFTCEGDTIVAIFDEQLDDPDSIAGGGLPDPLLAEIGRSRSGEMRDIVATIAAEQDEIIRAPLAECLIVQGGPGTGKTAVGLHRAAFLLFEHRAELSTSKVLVVGPNRMFLRYVGAVLPSLGETAVSQATVRSLLDVKYRVRGDEDLPTQVLKGDLRMAGILRSALLDKLKIPNSEEQLGVGTRTIGLSPDQIASAQKTALERRLPFSSSRNVFTQLLIREAKQQLIDRGVPELQVDETIRSLSGGEPLKRLVNRCWPTVGATTLLQSVLGNRALLKRCSANVLSDDEREMLHRRAASSASTEVWTEADLALLDEAEDLTTGTSMQYGHVVVDEAQDLSAMALRVVGRRARKGSITILGDIAQATAPSAQSSWGEVIRALGVDETQTAVSTSELTVGYRVPGPLLDFANRLLPTTAPHITPSTSVRHAGPGPDIQSVDTTDLIDTTVTVATSNAAKFQTTGVIVPAPLVDDVLAGLRAAGADPADTRTTQTLGASLSVVDAAAAKGLEFDVVVVVEPGEFTNLYPEALIGLRLLYVALTRAVQALTIVHSSPLPGQLRETKTNE